MRQGFVFSNVVFIVFCAPALAYDWSTNPGDGSPKNPYQISTAEQMNAIGADMALWDRHFKLMNDIDMLDLGSTSYNVIGTFVDYAEFLPFTGTFDGCGNVISNLTIISPDAFFVGLFGVISDASITSVGLENVNIIGYFSVGGLVGGNYSGTISNCYVTGTVSGCADVGGLVGDNSGLIVGCYTSSSVDGDAGIGGLVGVHSSSGDESLLNACYATGSVSGRLSVGGLVGSVSGGVLTSCYSTGFVSGESNVGGLVGGKNGGNVTSSFWDIQASGQMTSNGGIGKTTIEMQTLATFTDAGWDFIGESTNGLHDFWQMEDSDYPRLAIHLWTLEGEGTKDNPYLVLNGIDLGKVWLRPLACYHLGSNIDLSGVTWSFKVVPIFKGIFDGQDYTISNLTINMPDFDSVGLFGQTYASTQIRNVVVENVQVTGRRYVGGLVGLNKGGIFRSCYASGYVGGSRVVGGLIGQIGGQNDGGILDNCYSSADVSGTNDIIGGLIGGGFGMLTNCHSTGSVNGLKKVGGLAGSVGGKVINCYSTGTVTGQDSIGGLIGDNSADLVISCYATGTVTGSRGVGGLVAGNSRSTLLACYSTGSVIGRYAGGLVGVNSYYGNVIGCYAAGSVSYSNPIIGSPVIGGLIGDNATDNVVINSFWDVETSGLGSAGSIHNGAIGKTTAEMQSLTTFTDAGWDFANESKNGLHDFWLMEPNDYPRLPLRTWTLEGEGTHGNPYLISEMNDLGKVWLKPSACYRLDNNSDLSGINWSYPVIPIFSGFFDGYGHVVSNLYIQQPDLEHLGMFGTVENTGQIQNVGIQNANIYGSGYIGGLVGLNKGTIHGCYTTGFLTAKTGIGGLVGSNGGTIDNSYSTASVVGSLQQSTFLGGLVGSNSYKLNNCYSIGPVVCESDAYIGIYNGGMVGKHYYSYDRINACFWDTQTSGLEVSDGGIGKSTAQMQTLSTFTDAGWDFFFETDNGTEDIWFIREGIHYPKLWWEHHRPIADAGTDQTVYAFVDGYAEVQLDGTGSVDVDGDALEYYWYNDANELIATGAEQNVVLPVGEYMIDLIVNDGIADSEPNSCVVTVIEAIETGAKLMPQMLNRSGYRPHVIGRLEFAGEEMPVLDPNEPMVLMVGQTQIEPLRQNWVYSEEDTAWYLMGFFDNAALLEAIEKTGTSNSLALTPSPLRGTPSPKGGELNVTIAARMLTGQWVYGRDVVTVK